MSKDIKEELLNDVKHLFRDEHKFGNGTYVTLHKVGFYNWLSTAIDRVRKEEEVKHAGKVNGKDCFDWMESWLLAVEKQSGMDGVEGMTKPIMEWILDQPMGC